MSGEERERSGKQSGRRLTQSEAPMPVVARTSYRDRESGFLGSQCATSHRRDESIKGTNYLMKTKDAKYFQKCYTISEQAKRINTVLVLEGILP